MRMHTAAGVSIIDTSIAPSLFGHNFIEEFENTVKRTHFNFAKPLRPNDKKCCVISKKARLLAYHRHFYCPVALRSSKSFDDTYRWYTFYTLR